MPPFGVLGGVLAQVVAATPPCVQLPPMMGVNASLNLFLAFVGRSGAGKGGSVGVAKEAVSIRDRAKIYPVGSGEGLISIFALAEKVEGRWQTTRINDRALIDVPEVDTLNALGAGRAGSTIMPYLRQVWSGEEIGRTNATRERNVSIDPHSYRAVMLVGVQPDRAEVLLNDIGGTAQRFVWLPMTDRNPIDIDAPNPLPWEPPHEVKAAQFKRQPEVLIKVCQSAWDKAREERKRRMREEDGEILDGQAFLSRLKVAAAFGLLERRCEITEEDWQLAGWLMGKSNETRSKIADELRERSERQSKARGKSAGVQKAAADETEHEIKTAAASKAIRHKLDGQGWRARSDLRRAVYLTHRPYFDDAVEALRASGVIEEREVPGTSQHGTEYRLTGDAGKGVGV
jgi:hypothetical protein